MQSIGETTSANRKALIAFLEDARVVALAAELDAPLQYLMNYAENMYGSSGEGPLSLMGR